MAETEVVLRYTGGAFIPDVPARDLTADDIAAIKEADEAAAAAHLERVKALPKGAEQPPPPPQRRDRRWLQKSGLYEPADTPAKEG